MTSLEWKNRSDNYSNF